MTGSVSHGADVSRLREIGGNLVASAQSCDDLATSGRSMVQVLAEHWSGEDLERFAQSDWPQADSCLVRAGELLRTMGEQARTQADDQVSGSEGRGGGAGGGAGGGPADTSRRDTEAAEEGQSRDADDYGELPDGMTEVWEGYTTEEREAIAREIVRREAAKYGIEPIPEVIFVDDPEYTSNGSLVSHGDGTYTVKINASKLDDPMILHTIYHEVRHAGQHEMVDNQPGSIERAINDALGRDDYPDGVTQEQVDAWEENFEDYQSTKKGDTYEEYFEQPVEVDARAEGSEGVEGISPEETDDLLEQGQRTDTFIEIVEKVFPKMF